MAGPWERYASPNTTDTPKGPWEKYASPTVEATPQQQTDALSGTERFAKGATYGLLNGAEGAVNTLGKTVEGADPQKLAKLQSLISAVKERMGVSSDQYAPASQAAQDPNATLGQRLSNVPRSVVEMAGPAVVGGLVGGLPGAIGAIGATEAGPTVDRVREADNTSPDKELTVGQKARVAAKVATDMGLAAIGGKATLGAAEPIMATGLQGLKQAATQTGKAVGIDALAGSGATAVDKALVDKQLSSPTDLAVGAAQGGLPGLALRGPRDFGGGLKARENILSDLNPESLNRLNERIKIHKEAGAENPLAAAKSDIQNEIGFYKTENSPLLKDILDKTGHTDTTKVSLDNAIDAVKENRPVPAKTLDTLSNTLGGTYHGDNLLRLLSDHAALNKVNDLSQSSLSNSKLGKVLNPFGRWPTSALDLGASAVLLGGAHHIPYLGMVPPEVAAGLLGTQAAGYFGMKGIDKLTGASDINRLVNKVSKKNGGDTGAPITTPSFPELQAQARAQVAARNLQERQDNLTKAQDEKEAAKSDKQSLDSKDQLRAFADGQARAESSALWKTAIESLKARRNSDAIRERDVSDRVDDYQNRTLDSLNRLDQADVNAVNERAKATKQAIKDSKYLLGLRSRSDIPVYEAMGRSLGDSQNVPLQELVSSDATGSIKLNKATQQLSKAAQATEQSRQDALLRDVPRQLKLRENSESASSSPTALALAVAKLNRNAMENAEPQGPTAPPTSTPVSARPDLVKTNMRLEQIKKKAEAAKKKEATKQENIAAKAKAARRVKDATKKVEQSQEDVETQGIVIRHRNQKIVVPEGSGVRKIKNYKQSFIEKTDRRMDVIDAAKKLTKDEQVLERLDQLAQDWTDTTDNSQAHRVVENLINTVVNDSSTPKNVATYLKKNMHKVKNTWTNLDPVSTQVRGDD